MLPVDKRQRRHRWPASLEFSRPRYRVIPLPHPSGIAPSRAPACCKLRWQSFRNMRSGDRC
ncbi:hypothetical protein [Methylomonas montana]